MVESPDDTVIWSDRVRHSARARRDPRTGSGAPNGKVCTGS